MRTRVSPCLVAIGLLSVWPLGASAQEKPMVQIPDPGVPRILTTEGRRILSRDDEKFLEKDYEDSEKQVKEAFRKKS